MWYRLEKLISFKYLGISLCKNRTCSAKISTRIASAMAAIARLRRVWWIKTISFASKFKLYEFLVISILLYRCEAWTLLVDWEKRIQAFETKRLMKLLRVSYLEHKTKSNLLVGPQEPLLATVMSFLGRLVSKAWALFFRVSKGPCLTAAEEDEGNDVVAEKMLDGHTAKRLVDVIAHDGLALKRLWRIFAESSLMFPRRPSQPKRDWTVKAVEW